MSLLRFAVCFWAALFLLALHSSLAGVTNPDISAIGQIRTFVTTDSTDPNHDRGQFSFDEAELVFDAYLNPFAKGTFVFAVAEDGIEVEEGYFQIFRGLPKGLAFKAGKYRVGFGKLNPVHDHAYPFIERFRVLGEYLPGDEAYNEIGGQVSCVLPLPGTISSTLSADVLQGNSFKDEADESGQSRAAILGRWSNFFTLKGESSMELGVSATRGTNNVLDKTRTTVIGADAKAKLWFNPQNYLVLQAEFLALNREYLQVDEEGRSSTKSLTPNGGYLYADLNLRKRYNVGVDYERYQTATEEKPWDQAFGAFAGVGLMEETTVFRLVFNRYQPDSGQAYNTVTLQALFSMGPHKAHQF